MLDEHTLPVLREGRNLLAFSGGVDSTALFFLLLREDIPFDIAHVNYHTRVQSAQEAAYAQALADRYGKRCFLLDAEPIGKNFEAEARRVRYGFFESLIASEGYDTLLTAHQLDDRLEWLLMQLCKGAGLPELLGMESVTARAGYTLVRPLLGSGKSELRSWLDREDILYFEDTSNESTRHLRNRYRKQFAAPLLEAYGMGIKKSFAYLARDAQTLAGSKEAAIDTGILMTRTPQNRPDLMRMVDRWLKKEGYLLRRGEKERVLHEDELILGRRYALSITPSCTLVTPSCDAVMPKSFKEACRKLGIGPNVRPYLYADPATFEAVEAQLRAWQPGA